MPIAIFDPFSGISGDMTLGALLDVGLPADWLEALPRTLGLADIGVRIRDVRRGEIACRKVDFDIPPQPHGRGIREIRALVAAAPVPDDGVLLPPRAAILTRIGEERCGPWFHLTKSAARKRQTAEPTPRTPAV